MKNEKNENAGARDSNSIFFISAAKLKFSEEERGRSAIKIVLIINETRSL